MVAGPHIAEDIGGNDGNDGNGGNNDLCNGSVVSFSLQGFFHLAILFLIEPFQIYDNINKDKIYVLMSEAGRGFGGNGRDSVGEKKVSDTRLKGPLSAKAAWGNPSNALVFTRMPHFLVFSLQNCTLGFF